MDCHLSSNHIAQIFQVKRLSPSKTKVGHYDDDSKAYIVTDIADYRGIPGVFVTLFGLNRASKM